jgi:hypothetical protein
VAQAGTRHARHYPTTILGAGEQRGEPLQITFILEDLVSRGVSTSESASGDRAHLSVCVCIECTSELV